MQTFTRKRSDVSLLNRFTWFKNWLKGTNFAAITDSARKSDKTIKNTIRQFLKSVPQPLIIPNANCHLLIDGTWFGNHRCLLVYWDAGLKRVQFWRLVESENTSDLVHDLIFLKNHGVICQSITSDGGTSIRLAVSIVYPDLPHQRCLTHLQRLGLSFLGRQPKTIPGRQLRQLVDYLPKIDSSDEAISWLENFDSWRFQWKSFLKERTYTDNRLGWWYTHQSLRRVKTLLENSLPHLFYYLNNQTICKNTNCLEGRFGVLKSHYRQHRGLSKKHLPAYLSWYLFIVINREKPTLNFL